MKVAVLRHSYYDFETGNLTKEDLTVATARGAKLVEELGIPADVSDILLVSSSAPRATQTAEAIREGIGLPGNHEIHTSASLWDDNKHSGDMNKALEFILSLPPALFLIIVTHLDFIFDLSERLGYKEGFNGRSYLEGPIFVTNKSIIKRRFLGSDQTISEKDGTYEYGGVHEFNIILDGQRVITLMEIFSRLQSQADTWQSIIDPHDGETYQFLVPKIYPSGDPEYPEYSMSGGYDRDGIFPIKILFHTREERKSLNGIKFTNLPDISQIEAMRLIFGELEEISEYVPF